ncbi:MAG TPA: hypothetical protein GXX51_10080, partial [Firmicutes bacterium]|nr:hypothetical protein [Bacillota bacterium]
MDSISRILAEERLSSRFLWESLNRGLAVLDFLLEREEGNGNKILNVEFLKRARGEITRIVQAGSPLVKASVLVPVGLWGFTEGFSAPDLDIKILGIGNHRFFLFHSALGLVVLRHLYRLWVEKNEHPEKWASRVKRKVAGMLLGTYAVGVGVHLAIDVFQPKAVIFPFFGSLIDGTMVDDNIWLLGN